MESSLDSAQGTSLPPFYCPIKSPIHPRLSEIERQAIAWLDSSGIITNDVDRAWCIATRSAEFASRLGPHGDEELVLLFAQWNYWLFALDDARLDHETAGNKSEDLIDFAFRMVRSIESPGPSVLGDNPFSIALADLAQRTRRATSPVQYQRLADGLRDFLLGVLWQSHNKNNAVMPSLSDYIAGRISDVGGRFDIAFVEVVNNTEIPASQLCTDTFRALADATVFIVSCDNDLFSYAKENDPRAPGPARNQNIIHVIMDHDACSQSMAFAKAIALRDRAMSFFLELRDQLARDANGELDRYLQGLGFFIAGNIHWSNNAPRYASPRNRYELPQASATLNLTWRNSPSDLGMDPTNIPSISWWWKQLAPASQLQRRR